MRTNQVYSTLAYSNIFDPEQSDRPANLFTATHKALKQQKNHFETEDNKEMVEGREEITCS